MDQCQICFLNIPTDNIIKHGTECYDEQIKLLGENPSSNNQKNKLIRTLVEKQFNLTQIQTNALNYCLKKSKIYSKNTELNVKIRFFELGYTESDLESVINYFKNKLNVIIHFSLNKIGDYMINDICYRNLFETNTSSGNKCLEIRSQWENNLFGNIYKDSKNTEKVKYGCLNILNDRIGVSSAKGYGISYMILKDNVKLRCTFVCGDSSKQEKHICTFDNFLHLLLYLNQNLLKELIVVSNNNELYKTGLNKYIQHAYEYTEVQIHGDVIFSRDIQKLMIDKSEFNQHKLDRIFETHGIEYEII